MKFATLSKSEAAVLELVYVNGMTITEAANHSCRTRKTIHSHMLNARRKLGAKSSYQLGYMVGQLFTTKEPS